MTTRTYRLRIAFHTTLFEPSTRRMNMSTRFTLITSVALLSMVGCTAKKDETKSPSSSATSTHSQSALSQVALSQAALSLLEEADTMDGKTDHVIGKCYVCGLGMDGSDKFAVKVQDYTAHLCSAGCQHEFEASTEKIVLETKIPKAKE